MFPREGTSASTALRGRTTAMGAAGAMSAGLDNTLRRLERRAAIAPGIIRWRRERQGCMFCLGEVAVKAARWGKTTAMGAAGAMSACPDTFPLVRELNANFAQRETRPKS